MLILNHDPLWNPGDAKTPKHNPEPQAHSTQTAKPSPRFQAAEEKILVPKKCYRHGSLNLFAEPNPGQKNTTWKNIWKREFLGLIEKQHQSAKNFLRKGEYDNARKTILFTERVLQERIQNKKAGVNVALMRWENDFQPLLSEIDFHSNQLPKAKKSAFNQLKDLLKPEEFSQIQEYTQSHYDILLLDDYYKKYTTIALPLIKAGNIDTAKQVMGKIESEILKTRNHLGLTGTGVINDIWDGTNFPSTEQFQQALGVLSTTKARAQKDIIKISNKGKRDAISRWEAVHQGIWAVDRFDQLIQVPSLAHTNLRNSTRRKLIEGYLQNDKALLKAFDKEVAILQEVAAREVLVDQVFQKFVGQFPSFSSFLGQTRFSKESEKELNAWIEKKLGKRFAKRGMFEPDRKTLNKTEFAKKFDQIYQKDLKRAAMINQGLKWVLTEKTRLDHIFHIRKIIPDLTATPQNHFVFQVSENADYDEVKATLKLGTEEIASLDGFLSELQREAQIEGAQTDPSGAVNFFLAKTLSRHANLEMMESAENQGLALNIANIREDYLKDLNQLESFYEAKFNRLKAQFKKDHPAVTRIFLNSEEKWAEYLVKASPLDVKIEDMLYQPIPKNFNHFQHQAVVLYKGVLQFHGMNRNFKADWYYLKEFKKIQVAYQELQDFKSQRVEWEKKINSASTTKEFKEATSPIEKHQEKYLHQGMEGFLKQAKVVASRGEGSPPLQDIVKLGIFREEYVRARNIQDPKKRMEAINALSIKIQDYLLGITIEQEIAMVKSLRKSDSRWKTIKGGVMTMATGDSKNYHIEMHKTFGPYLDHLYKAKKLYQEGKIEQARNIYYALGQSKQRQIVIEQGQSSARWTGLVIGIGIVALSALTAGAATAAILPVGAKGLTLALAVGRFALNATTFWASERVLNGLINDQPILGRSSSVSGKFKELGGSWLETLALFGALGGTSKVFHKVLGGVLSRGAGRLAAKEGKILSQLPKAEKLAYIQKYQNSLGKLWKATIWTGHEMTTLAGLNAFSAATDPHYEIFSWDTQSDLLIFMAGLHAISPLSSRVIHKLDMRKVNRVHGRMKELDQRAEELVKKWDRYVQVSGSYQLRRSPEGRKFLREMNPESLVQEFRSLSKERIQFMKENAPWFGAEGIQNAQAQFLWSDWQMTTWIEKTKLKSNLLHFDGKGNIYYHPKRGVEILQKLPALFGENAAASPKIWLEVTDKGVIEATFSLASPTGGLSTQTILIQPRIAPVTKRALEKMREAIPAKNQTIDAHSGRPPAGTLLLNP